MANLSWRWSLALTLGLLVAVFLGVTATAGQQVEGEVTPEPFPFSDRYPAEVILASPADLAVLVRLDIDVGSVQSLDDSYPRPGDPAETLVATVYVDYAERAQLAAEGLEARPVPNESLRAWRTEQAKKQQVPPYIIFSNKVLEAIAARQPATLAELAEISGVGPAKLEQYGAELLALMANNPQTPIGPKETTLSVAESPLPLATSPTATPRETIIAVVTDLDGLLTIEGLAQLLTAAPDEIVSFSDHPRFAVFHGHLTGEAMQQEIRQVITAGQVALSPHRRLILPE